MNWYLIIATFAVLLALIVFLVSRNLKDKKEFEEQMNENYKKAKDTEDEMEVE